MKKEKTQNGNTKKHPTDYNYVSHVISLSEKQYKLVISCLTVTYAEAEKLGDLPNNAQGLQLSLELLSSWGSPPSGPLQLWGRWLLWNTAGVSLGINFQDLGSQYMVMLL